MSFVSDDEILELNADINDILTDDEAASIEIISDEVIHVESENQINLQRAPKEFLWLKFFRKGNLSCADLRSDLLSFLAFELKLKLNGLFFQDDVSVLVEVEVDNSLKSYLRSIYEERLGNKILKKKSIQNIVKICDGKFSVIVNNHLICLTLLHHFDAVLLPCKSLTFPFGLSSGEVVNIQSKSFIVDKRFTLYEAFLLIQEELVHNMFFFIGMRLMTCDDNTEEACMRFSVRHIYLNVKVLSKLKKIFSVLHFACTTMHLLPIHKVEDIKSACESMRMNDDLTSIISDDLIYPTKFIPAHVVSNSLCLRGNQHINGSGC